MRDSSSLLTGRFAVAALLTSIACAGGSDARDATTVRDSAGVAIVDNDVAALTDVCGIGDRPEITIGAADAGPDYELYRVFGASRLSDGRIVLVNQGSQQLRFYDAAGRFLDAVGRAGRGPGEFADAFYRACIRCSSRSRAATPPALAWSSATAPPPS
jgi:hypothetical protein